MTTGRARISAGQAKWVTPGAQVSEASLGSPFPATTCLKAIDLTRIMVVARSTEMWLRMRRAPNFPLTCWCACCQIWLSSLGSNLTILRHQALLPGHSCSNNRDVSKVREQLSQCFEHKLVDIAPAPILARLERFHNGMTRVMKVFGCVLIFR